LVATWSIKSMKTFALLCILLIALLPLIRADDSGRQDGEGVHDGDVDNRQLQVDNKGDELEVESESEKHGAADKFSFRVSLKDQGIRVDVESKVNDLAFQQRQRFTVYFAQVIQYSGGGDYTGDSNNTISTYSLANANWNQFQITQTAGKYVASASTSDGVFTISFEFSGQPFANGNLKLTPADLKINVGIRNFPYSGNSATDRLALQVFGKGRAAYQGTNTSRLVYNGGSAFTWVPTAVADTVTVNVGNSPITFHDDEADADEESKWFGVYFSFEANRPTAVDWDPTVSTSQYPNSAAGLIANLALVLFAIMLWV